MPPRTPKNLYNPVKPSNLGEWEAWLKPGLWSRPLFLWLRPPQWPRLRCPGPALASVGIS
jgi:hypothetical protein